ncbi:uncharacterized protein N7515_008775 [Penicillium bovifimosum]|uniref:Uncharacterized protein n=1 Tax=Penicillium bovifimosum TaxID=126998 RepID=A0A9W9GQ44_9EURO|nr:uncharacterized protein N7515_008775 [Penicillium bovifimosum]KAJ5124950.1 hypothetical protein N7515_008775 [Penicillium bovifimosum]
MSLLDTLSTRHRLSIWHIYHKSDSHMTITPFINAKKEFGSKHKETPEPANETNSYFVHHPTLLFHNAPRTLRRGNRKDGPPICILKCGVLWRNWILQFGDVLKGVLDPRGVVRWECRSNPNNMMNDDRALKGYRVRGWRVWGESGKVYHREVNERRRMEKEKGKGESRAGPEIGHTTDTAESEKQLNPTDIKASPPSYSAALSPRPQPAVAEEAVRLNWTSPFSTHPRRYAFEYANIEFIWEGTRDVYPDNKWAKIFMPFHHLKLIARMPGWGNGRLVAHYTPSFACRKFGQLWVFDNVVSELEQSLNSSTLEEERDVRETRLYDLVMATAVCMILGEWQKRTVLLALLALVAEGGNAG